MKMRERFAHGLEHSSFDINAAVALARGSNTDLDRDNLRNAFSKTAAVEAHMEEYKKSDHDTHIIVEKFIHDTLAASDKLPSSEATLRERNNTYIKILSARINELLK